MQEITVREFENILKEKNINPQNLQHMVVEKLIEKKLKVATAESCTGGLLSKRFTEVSGVSSVFDLGVCSYANEIKHKVLGVSQESLDIMGAVSAEVAVQMAQGVRKLAGAYYGISTTGIAGPTGGTDEKPVGLVYIAINSPEKSIVIKSFLQDDRKQNREIIRKTTTDLALFTLFSEID